jgi:hypothetical protein
MWPFKFFLIIHVVAGATGLVMFWVPVIGKKGAINHRFWGKLFCWLMMVTASMALSMGVCTLRDPVATHPHLLMEPVMTQAVFGWMMIYLAVLTVSLAWHGLEVVRNKRDHRRNRSFFSVTLQVIVVILALNCAWQGIVIGQPLLLGMPIIGVASAATNLWFSFTDHPPGYAYLMEHVKALVGTGISVYTAFTAFGAVHLFPKAALSPVTWSIPLVIGVAIILYHWVRIRVTRKTNAIVSTSVLAS